MKRKKFADGGSVGPDDAPLRSESTQTERAKRDFEDAESMGDVTAKAQRMVKDYETMQRGGRYASPGYPDRNIGRQGSYAKGGLVTSDKQEGGFVLPHIKAKREGR